MVPMAYIADLFPWVIEEEMKKANCILVVEWVRKENKNTMVVCCCLHCLLMKESTNPIFIFSFMAMIYCCLFTSHNTILYHLHLRILYTSPPGFIYQTKQLTAMDSSATDATTAPSASSRPARVPCVRWCGHRATKPSLTVPRVRGNMSKKIKEFRMLKFVETYGLLLLILLWLGNFHCQMKHFQGTSMLLIPKLAFSRVVREILGELYIGQGLCIQGSALEALQEATEAILVNELASKLILPCHCLDQCTNLWTSV